MDNTKSATVIYIMSDNRSGSTLLENILSKSNECFSVGELAMLKGHLLKQGPGERWNWNCSCGKSFTDCSFWSPILSEAQIKNDAEFLTNVTWSFKSKLLIVYSFLPFLFNNWLKKISKKQASIKVTNTLNKLYPLISKQSNKKYIIDSSKNPVQAFTVYENCKDIDVKIIWLKRDIRAIATSKRKWKELNKKREKSLFRLLWDIFYYKQVCATVIRMAKPEDVLVMDYEMLATNLQSSLDNICKHFSLENYTAPVYMELVEDHTVAGTPGRFTKKPIQYDPTWKDAYQSEKLSWITGGILNKL